MNNSIPIILGTTALGLLKKHVGSSMRLTTAPFTDVDVYFIMHIPVSRSLEITTEEVNDLEMKMYRLEDSGDLGFYMTEFHVHLRSVDEYAYPPSNENYYQITLSGHFSRDNLPANTTVGEVAKKAKERLKKIISTINNKIVEIDKSLKLSIRNPTSNTSDPMEMYNLELGEVIEYNWNRTNRPGQVNVMVPIEEDYNQTYTFRLSVGANPEYKVINADTGELYKPNIKASKLRRR